MGSRLMKAAVCLRPSSLGALTITDAAVPAVPEDGVLVRVHASSANPVDLYALTPVAHLQRGRKPAIVGTDFAGIVESVGSRVTRYRPGDEVFGGVRGAFAEYAAVAEDGAVARKPAGVSFEDAGTLAVAGTTALQALRDHGEAQRFLGGHRERDRLRAITSHGDDRGGRLEGRFVGDGGIGPRRDVGK